MRKICLVLAVVALLWLLFAPQYGLVSLWEKRSQLQTLSKENAELAKENEKIKREIEQIQEDPAHLEQIARKKNFLKKNERVYDFSKPDKQRK